MQGVTVECLCEWGALESVRGAWEDIILHFPSQGDSYEAYREIFAVASGQEEMRLVVLRENGRIVTLAPFVLSRWKKTYELGGRRLFSLPVRRLSLLNDSLVGLNGEAEMRRIFEALAERNDFDLVSFNEHGLESPFVRTLKGALAGSAWRCVNPFHKTSVHWLLDLPPTFDGYMSALSGKTRQTLRRKLAKFDKQYGVNVRVIADPGEVDGFLAAGEKISRMTYQWKVGQRLTFDEPTQRTYLANAKAGTLRCYLLLLGGEPIAFVRGNIRDGIYDYETPGYDPRYADDSPGTVLLLKVFEDLISNTDCRIFDFGIGGDYVGYKKILGNRSYECSFLEVGKRWSPYPILLFGIQDVLNSAKRTANAVLRQGQTKRFLKKWLRGG